MDNEDHIPVFVINLERSIDRRLHMEFQLKRLGIPFRIIPAVDGSSLNTALLQSAEKNRDRGLYRKPFIVGEIGCALSHLHAYEIIVKENLPCALLLEDDVFIEPHAAQLMKKNILAHMPAGWDMMLYAFVQRGNLYSKPYKNAHLRYAGCFTLRGCGSNAAFRAGIPTEFCYHAAGYLISRAGAEKLLTAGNPIRMPADILTGNARMFGLKSFALQTPCIRQHLLFAKNSTIKESYQELSPSMPLKKMLKKRIQTSSGCGFFAFISLIIRMFFLCINAAIACARGFIFPVRFLRKIGMVPLDLIQPLSAKRK